VNDRVNNLDYHRIYQIIKKKGITIELSLLSLVLSQTFRSIGK